MEYLLLGGPAHGETRELKDDDESYSVVGVGPDNVVNSVRYILREIEAETRPNVFYRRKVLVEQSVNPMVAAQALAQVLLKNFAEELVRQYMEGGELSGTDEQASSGTGTE